MTHRLKLKRIATVTHDTYRLVLPKPDGYDWKPGQATDVALDRDGWRDEKRPFTFVNDPKGDVDGDMLDALIDDWSQLFYLCGPPPMEKAVTALLRERGVPDDQIRTEE